MSTTGSRGKVMVSVLPLHVEQAGFEGRKKKIIGRLLLDGGTVEQPNRQHLELDLPRNSASHVVRGWPKK